MSRKDESAIVKIFTQGIAMLFGFFLPALLGAIAFASIFHVVPEIMSKFSNGLDLDVSITKSYSDYAQQFQRMFEAGGKLRFGMLAPAVLGAGLGCFLYALMNGVPGKKKH
ncbi:MAG: hypothetical protein J0L97_08050 [Alphaproteobacteria bacterium]|nr:hypothetical protein [Alphaproteobacteria bacterium]